MKTIHLLYLSLISIGILQTSCSSQVEQEAVLLGSWEAEWLNSGSNTRQENDVMHGTMTFSRDHRAEVEVYGYKDCVFFADTVKQQLQWQLVGDDTLQLLNPNTSFNISYAITDLPEETLQLNFMEDIIIKLKRL